MRGIASLVLCLLLATGVARAQALPSVEGCGASLPAKIDKDADFSTIGADGAKFRADTAPKFLAAIGDLCRASPRHQALVASRVGSVVLSSAPGAEEDISVYLSGRTLHIEVLDPAFHAGPFRRALTAALEKGSVAKASFDCAKAATVAEKLICSDGDLADADAALGDAYKERLAQAKADPAKLSALRAAQKDWVAGRDRECLASHAAAALDPAGPEAAAITACLTKATTARADALRASP